MMIQSKDSRQDPPWLPKISLVGNHIPIGWLFPGKVGQGCHGVSVFHSIIISLIVKIKKEDFACLENLLDILHPVNGMDSWIQAGGAEYPVSPSLSNS